MITGGINSLPLQPRPGLAPLTQLLFLDLSKNRITSTRGLERLTNLRELYLTENEIAEVAEIGRLYPLSVAEPRRPINTNDDLAGIITEVREIAVIAELQPLDSTLVVLDFAYNHWRLHIPPESWTFEYYYDSRRPHRSSARWIKKFLEDVTKGVYDEDPQKVEQERIRQEEEEEEERMDQLVSEGDYTLWQRRRTRIMGKDKKQKKLEHF